MKRLSEARTRDDGMAMLLVLGIGAIVTFLSVTVGTMAFNNLGNAVRDKQAASAFSTSEAGVAAVVERIRTGTIPLISLNCMEPQDPAAPLPASCTGSTMSWTSSVNPMQVRVDGQAGPCPLTVTCYKVWVGTISAYNPPVKREGTYRIHSTGLQGNGPGARSVVVDINVRPEDFPIGVYGDKVTGNGGTSLYNMSLFSRACVSPRQPGNGAGTRFVGIDKFWDQPSSAHSTTMVSTANNCGASGNIHASGACPNNAALNIDQSASGGPVTGGQCYRIHTRADGTFYPDALPTNGCTVRADGLCDSTSFTTADLQRYGYRPRGLSDDQYEALRSRAQATNTANTAPANLLGRLTTALNAGITQPVIYVDCASVPSPCDSSGVYKLSISNIPAAFQQTPSAGTARCASGPQPVLTIAVERGSLTFQGGNNTYMAAALFVPDGQWRGDGGYNILGTLFSNDLSLGGNENFYLDDCFIRDLPAPLLHIESLSFREDDSRDVN